MPVDVSLTIQRSVVEKLRIRNMGHPTNDRHDYEDDLRNYLWTYVDRNGVKHEGTVQHRRRDGALKLTQIVLNDMLGYGSVVKS